MSGQDHELPGLGEAPEPALVAPEGTVTSSEEEMDAVLAEIDPITAEEAAEGAPGEEPASQEDAAGEVEKSEEGEESTERPSVDQAEALEKAHAVLKRGKVPQAVIDNLSTNDALKWAEDLAKIQSEGDETYRRMKELEGELSSQGAAEGTSEEEPTESGEPSDGAGNPDPELTEFAEIYGEEAAAEVSKFIDSRVSKAEARSDGLERMLEGMMIRDAQTRLAERFPQLDEQKGLDDAIELAGKLLETGEYVGMDAIHDAVQAASRQLWAEEIATTQAAARNKRTQARRQGTPGTSRTNGTPTGDNLSHSQREDRVLAALEKGATVEQARRVWG